MLSLARRAILKQCVTPTVNVRHLASKFYTMELKDKTMTVNLDNFDLITLKDYTIYLKKYLPGYNANSAYQSYATEMICFDSEADARANYNQMIKAITNDCGK